MPDPATLKIGDRIRIVGVPVADLRQREHQIAENAEMAGRTTADDIERIMEQTPIVRVFRVDDDGCVWYGTTIIGADGSEEEHELIVYDDDTWEHVNRPDD